MPTDGSLWITLSTSYREYGNIGMESLQCLTGLYRKHLKYSLALAGVNAPPASYNAPAGPAVANGPSGGQYRATSSGLLTATRTCCPAAEPAQSPLKPPSEHDSPEENIDQDIGDYNDEEKKSKTSTITAIKIQVMKRRKKVTRKAMEKKWKRKGWRKIKQRSQKKVKKRLKKKVNPLSPDNPSLCPIP